MSKDKKPGKKQKKAVRARTTTDMTRKDVEAIESLSKRQVSAIGKLIRAVKDRNVSFGTESDWSSLTESSESDESSSSESEQERKKKKQRRR